MLWQEVIKKNSSSKFAMRFASTSPYNNSIVSLVLFLAHIPESRGMHSVHIASKMRDSASFKPPPQAASDQQQGCVPWRDCSCIITSHQQPDPRVPTTETLLRASHAAQICPASYLELAHRSREPQLTALTASPPARLTTKCASHNDSNNTCCTDCVAVRTANHRHL